MTATTDFRILKAEQGMSHTSNSPFDLKEIIVETGDTVDNTNTITLNLTNYGITNPKYIKGWIHVSNYDEINVEAPTTSGPGTAFVITVGGSLSNKKRVYLIGGY